MRAYCILMKVTFISIDHPYDNLIQMCMLNINSNLYTHAHKQH